MVEYVKLEDMKEPKQVKDIGFNGGDKLMSIYNSTVFAGYVMGASASLICINAFVTPVNPIITFSAVTFSIWRMWVSHSKWFKLMNNVWFTIKKLEKEVEILKRKK